MELGELEMYDIYFWPNGMIVICELMRSEIGVTEYSFVGNSCFDGEN